MEIIEAIQKEIKRQTREETALEFTQKVTLKVTKEVTQQILKDNINKLYRKGFPVEAIAEMLELELIFVKDATKSITV
jgi:hypothetical protein